MSNLETLKNQNDILFSFQEELDSFKKVIERKENGEQVNFDIEKYESILYKALLDLKNNIKDKKDILIFEGVLRKLENPLEQIDSSDLDFLKEILTKLEYVELEQTDLEKLKLSISESKKLKGEFSQLQNSIVKPNLTSEVKEVKEKIEKYREKLKTYSKKHPIWTKALILLLPKKLAILFKEKKKSNKLGNEVLSGALSSIKESFSFLTDFMAQLAAMFFSWFAPKEMKELLEKMTKDFKNIDSKLLETVGAGVFAGTIKDLKENSSEQLNEDVSFIEDKLKGYLPGMIKKISGKNISESQLNEIIKDLDLKNFFKDNTEELAEVVKALSGKEHDPNANYAKAGFEGIILPAKFTFKLYSVLRKRGYVSVSDLAVNFVKKSGEMVIGSFGLFGTGVEFLVGKISPEKFENDIKYMLDTDPIAGKEILAIMLYRHGGLLFSSLANIVNYGGKVLIYTLSGETSFTKTIISGLRGNVDEYLRVLQKFNNIVPPELKVDGINLLQKTIDELEQANNIVKLLKDNPSISGDNFVKFYEKKYGKIPVWLGDISGLNHTELKSQISNSISKIGGALDKEIGVLKSSLGGTFKGITSSSALLDELSKHINKTTDFLSEVVRNDNLFHNIRSQLKKLGLTANMLEIDPLYDKLVFKFKNPSNAKEFFSNLSKLAKQSPELLGFILDKTPIFLVAGLSAAKQDTLEDFAKELMYLVPFFGSGYMLVDALNVDKPNLYQAGISSVLLATETGYVIYQISANGLKQGGKNILKYILKPGKDIIEIAGFLSKAGFTTAKLSIDMLSLISKGKVNFPKLKLLVNETRFPALARVRYLPILIIGALFLGYEALAQDDEIKPILEGCKKDNNVDLACMDKIIKEKWQTLNKEAKSEFIALAYGIRTGKTDGLSADFEDGKYFIKLDEKYGVIPNYYTFKQVKLDMINLLNEKYGEQLLDEDIQLQFTKDLLKTVFSNNELDTNEKKKKYLLALGYDKSFVEKLVKN